MGFNTTVVILNDSLHDIEHDPDFGKNLAQAIYFLSSNNEPFHVSSNGSSNAAIVIETHHADYTTLIAVYWITKE